jgi:hypothetical protein
MYICFDRDCFSQQWMFDKQDLLRERQQDLKILTEEEYSKVMIFFANCKFSTSVFCQLPHWVESKK